MLCFPLALQLVSSRVEVPIPPVPPGGAALDEACGKSQLETFSIVDSTYGLRISKPEKPGRFIAYLRYAVLKWHQTAFVLRLT